MRTISQTIQNAVLTKDSIRMLLKAEIDPSRTFFETLSEDHPYDTEDYSAVTDTPVGQCVLFDAYMGDLFTFIIDSTSGVIYAMQKGSSTKHNLGITATLNTKPSAITLGNGTARLFYWNSGLYQCTVNLSSFGISGTSQIGINYIPDDWTIIAGSPTAIDEEHLVLCYKTSRGGIGIGFRDGNNWKHWEQRFLSPKKLTETAWTIYTSATILNDLLYVYSTDIDSGQVNAVEYNPYRDIWSDVFIALPADISRFCVTNAVNANGYVHLAGQFHRTSDLASARVYSLVLRSKDGHSFSWDRFTLLSTLGFQFQVAVDINAKKVYASDRNSVGISDMSYFWTPITNGRITLVPPNDVISFSSNASDGGSLVLAGAKEQFCDSTVIEKGSRVVLYLGYLTEGYPEGEYVDHCAYIIDSKNVSFESGKRGVTISLVDEGIWKTRQIAFPFYAELLSKSSQFDNCDHVDKMYPQLCTSNKWIDYLTVDFWNNEEWDGDGVVSGANFKWRNSSNEGCEFRTHTNYQGTTDQLRCKTMNLNEHPFLTDYPVISSSTVHMKLFGWERTSAGRYASVWNLYAVVAPKDDLTDKTVVTGSWTTDEVFPIEYETTQSGDYPIEFDFAMTNYHDYKLLYIGLTSSNDSAGDSTSYPERIEITGTQFSYDQCSSNNSWTLDKPDDETREYLLSPNTGLPNLLFTTKPYTSFNFNVAADFKYTAGASPLSAGDTYWGVVGLGKDGFDFVCARYHVQRSRLELILLRNGSETVLAYTTLGTVPYNIMLDHRNGLFRIWYRNTGDTWIGPVISYSFDEITYGVMSTSDTGIMHTGIIGAVASPGFICPSFGTSYGDGVMLSTYQNKSVLDAFPNSGTIVINGVVYDYTGKTTQLTSTDLAFGPNQARQTTDIGSWTENGIQYAGVGLEIGLYHPSYDPYAVANLLIGSDNNRTWLIRLSDWTVTHSNAGVPNPLRDRSKHYCSNASGNYIYTSDRVFINHGLTGISLREGTTGSHPFGAYATLYSTEKIWAKKVVSTQIDHDATVKDMLSLLCHSASIEAEFPGDWTQNDLEISSAPLRLAQEVVLFPGGADLRFTIPPLPNANDFIAFYGNNLVLTDTTDKVDLMIKHLSGAPGKLSVGVVPKTGTFPVQYVTTELSPSYNHDIRILIHGDFVSFYADDTTLATFAIGVEKLTWPEDTLELYAYADTTYHLSNVVLSELFDWREAVYIESEMSAQSAIGSVIQERPIEIFSTPTGNISFSYYFTKDAISYDVATCKKILRSHTKYHGESSNAGSDALIYYSDITFANNEHYAQQEGFNTRVFKLSTLETGAKTAGKLILEKAFQKQTMHKVVMRPDPRVEIGDVLTFDYVVAGTSKSINFSGIVETIQVGVVEGSYGMTVDMRDCTP